MTTKIHYEDNIFYLGTLVKTVKTGLVLEIDPEYFIDKVLEDILFIDSAFARTYASIKSNSYLIKKTDYLRGLLREKRMFISLLEDILNGKVPFSAHLEPFFPKFRDSLSEHMRDAFEIKTHLDGPRDEIALGGDVISAAEFQFLLGEDERTESPE